MEQTSELSPGRSYKSFNWAWLLLPVLLILALGFIYPLFSILSRSFTDPEPGIGNFIRFFESEAFIKVLSNTLRMALGVSFLTLILAYPYAYLMHHANPHLRNILFIIVLIPFWSSILVRTYAWTVILQRNGIINDFLQFIGLIESPLRLVRNFTGIMIGMTHVLLPFMVLPIYSVMQGIDGDLVRAAENLGASPQRAFREIFLPLSLPGVYAGVLLVFVVALGYYITPALLGSPRDMVMGQQVVRQIQDVRDWGMGSTLATILLLVTMFLLTVVGRIVNINTVLGGQTKDEN